MYNFKSQKSRLSNWGGGAYAPLSVATARDAVGTSNPLTKG